MPQSTNLPKPIILLAFAKEEYEIVVLDVLESMRNDNLLYLGQER